MSFSENKWRQPESDLISIEKDCEDSGLEELNDPKYSLFVKKTYQVIKSIEDLGLPKPGEQTRIVTFRSFNAAVFLAYICDRYPIDELLLVVYSINAEAAQLVNRLITTGRIKKAKILMSNLRNKAHREKEQVTRDNFVQNENVDLFFAQCHSKIMCLKTSNGDYFSIEGSGNLSFNSRVEQYVIDNDKGLYEFTRNWMDEIKTYLSGKKELILT